MWIKEVAGTGLPRWPKVGISGVMDWNHIPFLSWAPLFPRAAIRQYINNNKF